MIETYEFGQIVINGTRYTSDVIVYPDGRVDANWWRDKSHSLRYEDIAELANSAPQWIICGTGEDGQMDVDSELRILLEEQGITFEAMPTYDAVKLYNDLEGARSVGGCFHLTC
jgi:hypothetical protein